MRIHIIHCHHEPGSYTTALKNAALSALEAAGHTVTVSDLYAKNFNPKAANSDFTDKKAGEYVQYMLEQQRASKVGTLADDILEEFEHVKAADMLIFTTPIWWFSVPAMLKGWFDRVFATGLTWDFGRIYDKGLLRGKKTMLIAVPGGPPELYRKDGAHHATLIEVLHPILWGTLHFCGLDVLEPFVVHSPFQIGAEERARRIQELKARLASIESIPPLYTFS
jgi:NAD(P)H dehydrogenase (quinone)